ADRRHGAGRMDPFEALFEHDAEAAQFWWRVLRTRPPSGETPGTSMRTVRALLVGEATPAEFDRAVTAAARDTPPPHPDTPDGFARAMGLAAAYRAAGKPAEAIAALSEAADQTTEKAFDDPEGQIRRYGRGARAWVFGTDERVRLWLELGDLLMDAGKPAEAAKRFEQGWRWHPDCGLLLDLSGRALAAAGDAPEGKRRTELAHWVGLGNARVRGRFLQELVDRGHTADVRRERDLVRESGWRSDAFLGNVWNQVARASVLLRDFDGAASANRRAVHYLLRTPGVAYVEGYAYLTVPQAVRVHEARGLLAAGKVEGALSAAADALAVLPGNRDVPLGLVPELDRLGREKDADALFRKVWASYAAVIADHPDSAWARSTAAWLAAGCRRELDAALAHAEKAVELDPGVPAYREALAEVRFRRGDRPGAVAVMAKLVAADPRNFPYRRQLDRYRTAGFDSPLPEGTDD
ncbi:MAG: tetratricopeptide repeat protein, partial [Fimbriiglobus sp.]